MPIDTAAMTAPRNESRGSRPGLRALAETVDRLAVPLTHGRRLIAAELAVAWVELVGESLAARSSPDRIVFPPKRRTEGVLHLRVACGMAALELQHAEASLCQRINAWLGFAAVARLRLVHAPLPVAMRRPLPAERRVAPTAGATVSLAGIESPRLRDTLARLAREIGRTTCED